MRWELPGILEVNGKEYAINADYRTVLDVIARLEDRELDRSVRIAVCLALFYPDFDAISVQDYPEAAAQMFRFMSLSSC